MNNETVTINPKNLEILVNTNGALTRQLEAQRKRIEFLEMVLAQRFSLTVRTWDPAKTDEMKRKVELLWVEGTPGLGMTYEEAEDEFFVKWRFRSANVGQRIRDLRQEGKLWSKEVDGKVTFYLKLKEVAK